MNLSELLFKELSHLGVDYCSCVSGGGILYLLDAVGEYKNIKKNYFHHEQAAGIAAEAYTKATQRPAICLATIGPGVANAVSSAFSAYLNAAPVIFISGAKRTTVPVHYPSERFSFPQDADTKSLVSGVVKAFWEVANKEQLTTIVASAYQVATEGRPGPVWISVPLDIQTSPVDIEEYPYSGRDRSLRNITKDLESFLGRSKRTVLLTGSGADAVLSDSDYIDFIKNINLPCVTSISSGHTISMAEDLNLGTFGPVGRRSANHILVEADSLIVLGSGLDIDITGFDRKSFFDQKKLFVINPDSKMLIREAHDAKYIYENLKNIDFKDLKSIKSNQNQWTEYSRKVNEVLSVQFEIDFHRDLKMIGVDPYLFAYQLGSMLPNKTGICLGISLDVVSVSHSMSLKEGSRTFASKHCGQLGWDIPAAIGLADSGCFEQIVCITGDGSIMFNLQDLATLSRTNLPVHIYIYDNDGYNSIRTSQNAHLEGRLHGSDLRDLSFPKWQSIAEAFGFIYSEINNNDEIAKKLDADYGVNKLFCVLKVDPDRSRTPRLVSKLKDGKFYSPSLAEQFPFLDEKIGSELRSAKLKYLE